MASRTLKQLCVLTLASLVTAASPPNGPWNSQSSTTNWNNGNSNGNDFWGPGSNTPGSYNPDSPINTFNPSAFAESAIGMAPSTASHMIQIHGILASIAFVALFPIGSIAIRVIPSKHAWLVHAVTQVVAYTLYIAAAAIGLWLVSTLHFPVGFGSGISGGNGVEEISLFSITAINYHFIIGVVVLVVVFFQPLTGFVHHIKYKHAAQAAAATSSSTAYNDKEYYSVSPQRNGTPQRSVGDTPYIKRTAWSHLHLWLGRIAITMGMINGGLGLGISGSSDNLIIAYSVIAGVMWLIWVAAMVYGEVKRSKARAVEKKRPRDMRVMPGTYTGGEAYSTYRAPGGNVGAARGGRGGRGGGGGGGGAYSPVYENPDAVGNAETVQRFKDQQQQPQTQQRQQQQEDGSGWSTSSVSSDMRRSEQALRDNQQRAGDRATFYRTPPPPPPQVGNVSKTAPKPTSPDLPIQAPQPRRDGHVVGEQQPVNRNDTVSPLSIYAVRY